jgi:amino acid transporter
MASRLLYGMGNRGIMPKAFSRIHHQRRTPWVAIVFATMISLVLVGYGEIGVLAETTVLLLLVVFAMVNVSALVLRKDKVGHVHFTSPILFPVTGIGVCCGLLARQPAQAGVNALILLVVGAAFYGLTRLLEKSQEQA